MNKLDRRTFLRNSLLASASVSLIPALGCRTTPSSVHSQVPGANGDIRFAVVGFKSRGEDHIEGLRKVKGTRLVALCDVDREVLDKQVKKLREGGEQVDGYVDIRELVARRDIDVISIATPNHWHSLAAIWAIQAGKDVYVEKPVSHNVWEGRQLVKAARKYNRIVQAGTQSRSSSGIRDAIQWARDGNMGKIIRARGLCYKRRASIGKVDGPQPVPSSINYDLWCGPAPMGPLMRKRLHYDWHWVWPTGNGDLGNQGIHQMDIARWVLGENALSPKVISLGGRLGYVDDGTTPNTQIVFHDYPAAPLIFEVRGLPTSSTNDKMDSYKGASIGVVVDLEGGMMVIPDYNSATFFDKQGKGSEEIRWQFQPLSEFYRRRAQPQLGFAKRRGAPGTPFQRLCHTGNVSYLLGQTGTPEEIRDKIKNNADLSETFGRMEQHLAANKVDLHKTPARLGTLLSMNPKSEEFVGNPQANKLLTREYRKPFVVPERV
jgi:predicted dehydrogenase